MSATDISTTEQTPSIFANMMPLLLILAVFYILIIRPQQKKAQEHQKMLLGVKKGDKVSTNSGIIGTIKNVEDKEISLEIANGVLITIKKDSIIEILPNDIKPASIKEETKKEAHSTKTTKSQTKKSTTKKSSNKKTK